MVVRHKLSLDPAAVANELELFTRLRIGAPLPQPTPTTFPSGYTALSAGVGDIKKLATGAGILMAWDASGEAAVASDVANNRASTCADCPLNSMAKLDQWNTVPVAMSLKSRLSRIEKIRLKTPSDSKLGLCDGIYSPTAMLVHAPLSIVNRKLKADMRANLHEGCWIKSEQ